MVGRPGKEATVLRPGEHERGDADTDERAVETEAVALRPPLNALREDGETFGAASNPEVTSTEGRETRIDPDASARRRRAVLVLGMHRSGTSVVTGTFTRLGLGGPASPVPPNFDNPAGFYESEAIVDLNDRILTALGSSYDDWSRVDPGRLPGAAVDKFRAEAMLRYLEEYSDTDLAAVKDPRMCRLLPFWRDALDRIGVEMRVVVVSRSPVEVTASLNKRNGFSADIGLLLWLRHVLDAERETRDLPRCFVGMDEFLGDWRRCVARIAERIDLRWPRYDPEAEAEIDGYVSKPLRNNVATARDVSALQRWIVDAGRALEELAEDPYARQAQAELDRIGEWFEGACALFSKVARDGYNWANGLLSEANDLKQRLAETEAMASQLAQAREQIERDRQLATDLDDVRSKAQEAAATAQVERRRLGEQLAAARSEVTAHRIAQEKHLREIDHLREAAAHRGDYVSRMTEERDAANASLERRDAIVAQLEAERDEARQAAGERDGAREAAKIRRGIVAGLTRSPMGRIAAPLRVLRRHPGRPSSSRQDEAANPFFDRDWYLARYADVRVGGLDAYRHYLEIGTGEGRNPSATFDTQWYLARYPDVRDGGGNPLVHYWRHGRDEGRLPGPDALNPFFDEAWYVARYVEQHGDAVGLGIEPYHHYLNVGAAEGRDPSPVFGTTAYLDANPDVREGGWNPLEHYWRHGKSEGRQAPRSASAGLSPGDQLANPHFDRDWYLERYADVREGGLDPYQHYIETGADESRDPSAVFDTQWYLARYPDVRESGGNPLVHYWLHGRAEGRLPGPVALNPHFDTDWYVGEYGGETDLGREPYHHYLSVGADEGRDPSPVFSTNAYLATHDDVRESGMNPLEHYWRLGQAEGREVQPSDLVPVEEESPNPFFDRAWYLAQYADVRHSGLDAYRHYLELGAAKGYDPSAAFSTAWYLERYPDIREAGSNPLVHYWEFGEAEGRLPGPAALNPHFDRDWYRAQYSAQTDLGPEPYHHYLSVGAAEGRDPSPAFSTSAYLAAYPDVRDGGMNPLHHYWRYGEAEGRRIEPSVLTRPSEPEIDLRALGAEFDRAFYLSRYPDVRTNRADPWVHYLLYGEPEGRLPNAVFDPVFYRNVYADVRAAGGSPFEHYQVTGVYEGRLPSEVMRPSRAGGSRLLFIGHDSYAAGSQRVLLEVIAWFQEHTLYDISVLLLGSGHLTTDYARIARTFTVGTDIAAEADLVRRFVGPSPDVVYFNTVVSGRALIPELADLFSKSIVIAHCHELANIIGQFQEPYEALRARADRWIGASPATTRLLRADPALKSRSVETVHAFIRPSALSGEERDALRRRERAALGIARDALVVLGCGTVHWRKDPEIFVAAALELLPRAKHLDIHFVWVGDGEDAPGLQDLIREVGASDRIRFTGYRPNAGDLMCLGDVFFMSSLEDPFPLVVLEAGQFGIPAVCFDHATGMTDLVARGGRVVAERSAELAAEALLDLLTDAPLRARLGAALRAEVAERYTLDVQIPRILTNLHQAGARPAVSIVVPNYNHAPFLETRLRSLLSQTMQDFEVVILDDASQDDSLRVIETFTADLRTRLVVNEVNSGSSFRQWQRGVELARADVIWIAESDDACEPNFLAKLAPHMLREEVNIAFARTVIIDEAGTAIPDALKPYLDRMAPGFGETAFVRSGAAFVNEGFAALCVIVNASGALLRRGVVERALPDAREFRMCGDWRVYLEAMNGGSVAYEPTAINYFRRHTASTVHRLEGTDLYFEERLRIARYVADNFRTTPAVRQRMQNELQHEADRFRGRYDAGLDIDLGGIFAASLHPDYVDQRVHVAFYVHGMLFSTGGIERLFAMISAVLVDRGFRVSLVCAPYARGSVPVFPLRPEIAITPLDITNTVGVSALRRLLEGRRVDVFVPMLSEKLFEKAFEAAEGLELAIIASEHNNPSAIEELWWSRERRLACFAKADAIHLVARIFAASLPDALREKVQVIPHAIAPEFARAVRQPSEPPTIVAVGRLARQKRFDLLIKAFALLSDEFPDWRLVIYGEGGERQHLFGMVQALDLTESVDLPGTTPDMVGVLERAGLFVLSSEFEATGLALIEALAVGVPTVAFAACEGNGDLIEDGENGLLAPDFTAVSLASAMRRMMSDPALRERCGRAARRALAEFDLDRAADQWEKLILSQADARSSSRPAG